MAHSHTARPRHCTATARIARCPAPSRCGSRPSALGLPPGGRKAARRALRIERHRTQPPKTPVRRDLASPARRPAPRAPHPHARTSPKHAAERRPILRSAHSRPCTRSIHAVPRRRALGRIALPMPPRPRPPPPRPSAAPLPRIWMRMPFCTQKAGPLPLRSILTPHLPGLLPKLDFHPRIICVQIGILVHLGPDSVRHLPVPRGTGCPLGLRPLGLGLPSGDRKVAQKARGPKRPPPRPRPPPPWPSAAPLPRIWMRMPFCTQKAGPLPLRSILTPHLPGLLPKLDFHPRIICVQIGILVHLGPDSVRHPCSPFCPHRPFAPFR